jgi:hypothetical protein
MNPATEELLEAARRYVEWTEHSATDLEDLKEWQRLRDAVEAAETEQPTGQHAKIETLAAMVAAEITAELYGPSEFAATLARRRVASALEDAAATAIKRWIDLAE